MGPPHHLRGRLADRPEQQAEGPGRGTGRGQEAPQGRGRPAGGEAERALERIPDLKTQAVNAATRIEALNDELQVVEAQLARRAQEIVEDRHKLPFWKKGLKVLATIAKAIPVGQPVVGGLGTSLDVVLNFDSDKPWETVIAIPDAVGAFAKSDVDTKAKDAQKKKDEEKPEGRQTRPSKRLYRTPASSSAR